VAEVEIRWVIMLARASATRHLIGSAMRATSLSQGGNTRRDSSPKAWRFGEARPRAIHHALLPAPPRLPWRRWSFLDKVAATGALCPLRM
jgi:hypothetical protein